MADRIVIYFNFDGFAYYYYQIAHERNLIPFIDFLIANGVFFESCYTGIPAITNPMQCAISSGCYSGRTKNVKIYYDKETRTIISQKEKTELKILLIAYNAKELNVALYIISHLKITGQF